MKKYRYFISYAIKTFPEASIFSNSLIGTDEPIDNYDKILQITKGIKEEKGYDIVILNWIRLASYD